MHYIAGTRFSIAPDPTRGFRSRESSFSVNTIYTLSTITRHDNKLNYTFIGTDRSCVTLTFESARIADSFIAKHRRETLPNYDSVSENEDI